MLLLAADEQIAEHHQSITIQLASRSNSKEIQWNRNGIEPDRKGEETCRLNRIQTDDEAGDAYCGLSVAWINSNRNQSRQDCGFAVGTGRIDEIYCLCYADEEGEYRKPPNRIPRPLEISIRHVGSTRRRRRPVNPIQVRRVLLTPSEPPTFLNPPPVSEELIS